MRYFVFFDLRILASSQYAFRLHSVIHKSWLLLEPEKHRETETTKASV